jgi:hypothetical protein
MTVDTRRVLCLGALVLATLVGSSGIIASGAAQESGPAIVFNSPVDSGYISGPTTVSVRIVPAGEAAKSVSLFADGTLLCTLERPPYTCPWDSST